MTGKSCASKRKRSTNKSPSSKRPLRNSKRMMMQLPPWENLPRPFVSLLCDYLSIEDQNNLRLTSKTFSKMMLSVSHHYEEGMVYFCGDSFVKTLMDVLTLQSNNSVTVLPQDPEYHLCILVKDKQFFYNFGKIIFTKKCIQIRLHVDSLNTDQLKDSRNIIEFLKNKNVSEVAHTIASQGRHLISDLSKLSTMKNLNLQCRLKVCRKEVGTLVRKFAHQLEQLEIGDSSCSKIDLTDDFTNEFPNMKFIRLPSKSLGVLARCSSSLKCLDARMGPNSHILSRLNFPRLQHLTLDTGFGKICKLILEKCCDTLQLLQIASEIDNVENDDLKNWGLVFPKLKELQFLSENPAAYSILDCSFPVLEGMD